MSLGKASVHARKQKSLAKCHVAVQEEYRAPSTMQMPVLVLNASYEPINICGARRALVLVLKGVAKTEEEQGAFLHAARMNLALPSVIRLLEYRRIPHQTRALSRKNILSARPQYLPILFSIVASGRADAGSRATAFPRRAFNLGESCCLLPLLQSAQGESPAARDGRHAIAARATAVFAAYQPSHYAHDRPLRPEVATVSVLLDGIDRPISIPHPDRAWHSAWGVRAFHSGAAHRCW